MDEWMTLLRMLWNGLRLIGSLLAVPACVLLAVLTAAGFIVLIVCAQVEVYKDRERARNGQ